MPNPAQAVIGLSFGRRSLDGPDPVNERLVRIVDTIAAKCEIPVMLQPELFERSSTREKFVISRGDTFRAFQYAQGAYCVLRGIKTIVIVAGSLHAPRCRKVAEGFDFEVVGEFGTSDIFDPLSEQWWTRSLWRNMPRELGACMWYKAHGWI